MQWMFFPNCLGKNISAYKYVACIKWPFEYYDEYTLMCIGRKNISTDYIV